MKKLYLGLVGVLSLTPLHAEFFVGKGATGSNFLKIPLSARAAALGGSYTAMFGDAGTMEYNPAGLAGTYRTDLNATYQVYFEDTSLASVSMATPISFRNDMRLAPNSAPFIPKDKVFFGLHYRTLSANDTARNDIGGSMGSLNSKDQLIQGSLAYAAFDQVSLGASGKYINRKIKDQAMSTYAVDLGLIFMANERLSFGTSILNWGQDKAFLAVKEPLPTTLRVGAKWDASRTFTFLTDFSEGRDKISRASLGSEITLIPQVRLRAGIVSAASTVEYTGGMGFKFKPSLMSTPVSRPTPTDETDIRKKTLDDLDGNTGKPRQINSTPFDLEFGLDYAARFTTILGFTHSFTFRILF